MTILEDLRQAIIEGNAPAARQLTEQGLGVGILPADFFPHAIIPAMEEVGHRMSAGEFYIPEVLIAARASRTVTDVLKPLLGAEQSVKPVATVVIGVVKGDLHDIGKNIVSMMLEGAGFRVIDLGTDVSPEDFVQAVREHKANIVAMSALLTTTMVNMQPVVASLESAGLRNDVKVMVGGAPLTEQWARSIGADAYGKDAPTAVVVAKCLVGRGA